MILRNSDEAMASSASVVATAMVRHAANEYEGRLKILKLLETIELASIERLTVINNFTF